MPKQFGRGGTEPRWNLIGFGNSMGFKFGISMWRFSNIFNAMFRTTQENVIWEATSK